MARSMGRIIKELRKRAGLTQDELAERLNISPQAVSRWENEISSPDISQIVPLATVFGVATDVLFGVTADNAEAAVNGLKSEIKSGMSKPEALKCWYELIDRYPRNAEIYFNTARTHVTSPAKFPDDYTAAMEFYKKILDTNAEPKLKKKSRAMLMWCCRTLGDSEGLVKCAEEADDFNACREVILARTDGYESRNGMNKMLFELCLNEQVMCVERFCFSDAEKCKKAEGLMLAIRDRAKEVEEMMNGA